MGWTDRETDGLMDQPTDRWTDTYTPTHKKKHTRMRSQNYQDSGGAMMTDSKKDTITPSNTYTHMYAKVLPRLTRNAFFVFFVLFDPLTF